MTNNKAVSFLVVMIIVAVTALILRVAIVKIIKFNIDQNESLAAAQLKLVSAALENYARDNKGVFPATILVLTQTKPPYLNKDCTGASSVRGYSYACPRLDASGYSCSAAPSICNLTGKKNYTVTTGGPVLSEDCARKE
jgi:type II secretory pathway pseudopilin PulG